MSERIPDMRDDKTREIDRLKAELAKEVSAHKVTCQDWAEEIETRIKCVEAAEFEINRLSTRRSKACEEVRHCIRDIIEARTQGKFTHEAGLWLDAIKRRLENLLPFEYGGQQALAELEKE